MTRRRRSRAARRVRRRMWAAAVALGGGWWLCVEHPAIVITLLVIATSAAAIWLQSRFWATRRRAETAARELDRPERMWLYRHYDRTGRLLYVGITNNYTLRCGQHADDKPWWVYVDGRRSTCQGPYPNRRAALAAEEAAIRGESPVFNTVHNPVQPWIAQARYLQDLQVTA